MLLLFLVILPLHTSTLRFFFSSGAGVVVSNRGLVGLFVSFLNRRMDLRIDKKERTTNKSNKTRRMVSLCLRYKDAHCFSMGAIVLHCDNASLERTFGIDVWRECHWSAKRKKKGKRKLRSTRTKVEKDKKLHVKTPGQMRVVMTYGKAHEYVIYPRSWLPW